VEGRISMSEKKLYRLQVLIIESLTGAVKIERKRKTLRAVPYEEIEAPLPEVSSKELMDALAPKSKKRYIPPKNHPWKRNHFP